jgi:hypothetical protein
MASVSFSRPAGAPAATTQRPAVAAPATTQTATPTAATTQQPAPAAAPAPQQGASLAVEDQLAAARKLLAEHAPAPAAPPEHGAGHAAHGSPTQAFDAHAQAAIVEGRQAAAADSQLAASMSGTGDMDGEFGMRDLQLPRLNLVQKSGELPDKFAPGNYVFQKLVALPTPLSMIALHIRKQYQERIPWELRQNQTPRVFNTAAEVAAAGGRLGFKPFEFGDMAHVALLIAYDAILDTNPDAASFHDMAIFEIAGKKWAPAVITVNSSGYTNFVKPLMTARTLQLREGLWFGLWEVSSKKETKGLNTWYVPQLAYRGKLGADDAAIAKSVHDNK